MVVPHEDKQNQNKSTIDTWSSREISVRPTPSKIKLQADQEIFKQSNPDKIQS